MGKKVTQSIAAAILLAISVSATERQPNADYRARREALAKKITGHAVILFAPTEPTGPNAIYGFHQEDNIFYLTGLSDPGIAILIAPAVEATETVPARPYSEVLFLPGRNVTEEKWTGPKLTPETQNLRDVTGFERVLPLDGMRDELVRLLPQPRATVFADLSAQAPSAVPLDWLRRANAFPNYISFAEVRPAISALRTVKDAGEAALIRKATDASAAAHLSVMRAMKPNLTEQEISALFQYEFLRRGCERPAYVPIVGSGFNGTVLHYKANSGTIRDGDLVVMDVGGEYSGYASDITRTLPANGKFSKRQREIYEIVLGAQKAAEAAFKTGVSTRSGFSPDSLHKVAMDYINSHGKDLHGGPLGKYFIHGLSHFVGLNVHDPGDNVPLQPGMVFTIEPGIYLPEENLGVRIEDMYWVNEKGELVNLSAKLPRTVEDVEKAMAAKK